VIQDPGYLGAGEVRIEDEAGLAGDLRLHAFALQRGAVLGGAAVLPDDCLVDRPAGLAVPHHGGLALVGDADTGNVAGGDLRLRPRAAAGLERRAPEILRVVLDPSRAREMLRKLLLRRSDDAVIGVEQDG